MDHQWSKYRLYDRNYRHNPNDKVTSYEDCSMDPSRMFDVWLIEQYYVLDHNKNEQPCKRRLNKSRIKSNDNHNSNDVCNGNNNDASGDDTSDNNGLNDTTTTDTDLTVSEFEAEIDIDQGLCHITNTDQTINLKKLANTTVEGLGFKDPEMTCYLKLSRNSQFIEVNV